MRTKLAIVTFGAFICIFTGSAAAVVGQAGGSRCMGSNKAIDLDARIAACTAEIENPYAFGWFNMDIATGQENRSEPPNGIRGLLYNSRGAAWKEKGDLRRAIADFEEAVRFAQLAGQNRPNFVRNLNEARAAAQIEDRQNQLRAQQMAEFSASYEACREYAISACERAQQLAAQLTELGRQLELLELRSLAGRFQEDLSRCRNGSVAACEWRSHIPA